MGMNSVPLRELRADAYFTGPVFLDERYILLTPEIPVSSRLINLLAEFEMRQVFTEGQLKSDIPSGQTAEEVAAELNAEAELSSAKVGSDSGSQMAKAGSHYDQFLKFIETVYTRYVTKNDISLKEIQDRVKALVDMITDNRKQMLRAMSEAPPSSNYLVNHSARSSVLAVVLGLQVKLPTHRLIELGVAAALHEIGMVRLPPQLYMATRPLTPVEFKSVTAHPILGYNILKEKQFSLAICLAALEHHERMNGSGYPRAISGDKISLYAKIIAVACSYDAVTGARPFREAREGHEGMVDLLKNEGKRYDDLVIKALVYSLSLYPIGSYVLLTNAKPGQVVDVNPENPRYPVVRILGVHAADGKETLVQTAENGIRVLRALAKPESEALLKGGE